jgi:hypothetical protein
MHVPDQEIASYVGVLSCVKEGFRRLTWRCLSPMRSSKYLPSLR